MRDQNQIDKFTLCCITTGTALVSTLIGALISMGMKESTECDDCENNEKFNILPPVLGAALGVVAPLFSYGLFRCFSHRREEEANSLLSSVESSNDDLTKNNELTV